MKTDSDVEKHYKYKKKNHKIYHPDSALGGYTATDFSKSEDAAKTFNIPHCR